MLRLTQIVFNRVHELWNIFCRSVLLWRFFFFVWIVGTAVPFVLFLLQSSSFLSYKFGFIVDCAQIWNTVWSLWPLCKRKQIKTFIFSCIILSYIQLMLPRASFLLTVHHSIHSLNYNDFVSFFSSLSLSVDLSVVPFSSLVVLFFWLSVSRVFCSCTLAAQLTVFPLKSKLNGFDAWTCKSKTACARCFVVVARSLIKYIVQVFYFIFVHWFRLYSDTQSRTHINATQKHWPVRILYRPPYTHMLAV